MGGNAFGYLHETAERREQTAQAMVFGELADNFGRFVGLVAVVTGRSPAMLRA